MPTLKELKKLAAQRKIKGRSKMNKAQLEAALGIKVKSRKSIVKKSRKSIVKKSRKARVKKSRKPKKKSRKSKSKFKVRKDRVPSLFELAAQKLPHTSEWAEGSNIHLKGLVTKPQQKRLKRIMGSDLIKEISSRRAIIKPLSKKEIDILMNAAFDFDDLRAPPDSEEVNAVYSTLKNLREIPDVSERYEAPEFFLSYADRLSEAREDYIRKLSQNLKDVRHDIQAVKEEVESDGRPFDFERDFTFEDEHGNMLTGSAAARSERQFLDEMAWENYKHRLAVAETYRNDLFNYAYAAVADYRKYGDDDWLHWPMMMGSFGRNNELYHQYRP